MFEDKLLAYEDAIEVCKEASNLMEAVPDLIDIKHYLYMPSLDFQGYELEDLHKIRSLLRGYFGSWEDKICYKSASRNYIYISFKGVEEYNWIEIRMSFERNKESEKLLGNCQIIEETTTPEPTTTYDVVCPMEGK